MDAFDDLLHLAAVGAGVHVHCAAELPRNAPRKFKAREPLPTCKAAYRRKRCTRAAQNMTVRKALHLFKIALQRQHRAAQALVRHKQIGTIAEDEIRDILVAYSI